MKLFKDYQDRCNRFYMQVVSQLCFENSSPPSEEVIGHLLKLIIYKKTIPQLNVTLIRTRQMTIFETVVDTTPVFRSFLLQLLVRTRWWFCLSRFYNLSFLFLTSIYILITFFSQKYIIMSKVKVLNWNCYNKKGLYLANSNLATMLEDR